MATRTLLATSLIIAGGAMAREVPSNVRDFVNSVRGKGQCDNVLARGFFTSWDDTVGGTLWPLVSDNWRWHSLGLPLSQE
jgi:hypothetical protein